MSLAVHSATIEQHNVTEICSLDDVPETFPLFSSLSRLIHPAVRFPACIEGCYFMLLQQV
jgi:hypothetical protein